MNEKIPPRKFPTVGIEQEFRQTTTQLPPQKHHHHGVPFAPPTASIQ